MDLEEASNSQRIKIYNTLFKLKFPCAMGDCQGGEPRFSPLTASANLVRAPHSNKEAILGEHSPRIAEKKHEGWITTKNKGFRRSLIATATQIVIFTLSWLHWTDLCVVSKPDAIAEQVTPLNIS